MQHNPYQAPESDLGGVDVLKRAIWWKVYFFVMTFVSGLGALILTLDPNAGISEYVMLVTWLAGTTGFFGFVFLKPIYKPVFWLQVLIGYVVFSIAYYFVTDVDLRMGMTDTQFYVSNAINWIICLPFLYGLYDYARPGNPIWQRQQAGGKD